MGKLRCILSSHSYKHYGMHCELESPCPKIIGASFNDTWYAIPTPDCEPLLEYNRPVYQLSHESDVFKTSNNVVTASNDDIIYLVYSGSRWFGIVVKGGANMTIDQAVNIAEEFHAFWDRAYAEFDVFAVSDPTTNSVPVGVDFYLIGEKGPQYGPFGVLTPLQDPPGRGVFRCDDYDNAVGPVSHLNLNVSCP